MHGVEADSHASEHGRNAAEDADLRAVYVHDIRPDPPAEANQLNECQQVVPWVDLPSEVVERYERNPGFLRRFAQQPRSMSSDRHVEIPPQRGEKVGDGHLCAADFGERDQHQNTWFRRGGRRRSLAPFDHRRPDRRRHRSQRVDGEVTGRQECREEDRQQDRSRISQALNRGSPERRRV